MSMATMATATDDDVFRAFALGDELQGDTARAAVIGRESIGSLLGTEDSWTAPQEIRTGALYSHGVLLALRSEECVVFDARPCHDGERCVCAYVKHAARARKAAGVHYAADEVCSLDHGAFVDLARRLGAVL